MARLGGKKRAVKRESERDGGFQWWYEDIEPTLPAATSPYEPAPPMSTGVLAGSW